MPSLRSGDPGSVVLVAAPVTKSPAKKSPAKKTVAKKAPAKKSPVKKSPAKKAPAAEKAVPAPKRFTGAAFFDLDRTLLAGASGPVFSQALREVGVLTGEAHPVESALFKVFDVFGDVVNLAARLESSGVPGRVHILRSSLPHFGAFEPSLVLEGVGTAVVELKGIGAVETDDTSRALGADLARAMSDALSTEPTLRLVAEGAAAEETVDATVRVASDRVRVRLRLLSTRGDTLWADKLEGTLSDPFGLEDAVAGRGAAGGDEVAGGVAGEAARVGVAEVGAALGAEVAAVALLGEDDLPVAAALEHAAGAGAAAALLGAARAAAAGLRAGAGAPARAGGGRVGDAGWAGVAAARGDGRGADQRRGREGEVQLESGHE